MYMDDILVKSALAGDLIGDLEETFSILRRHDLKLNPSKYIFGVRSSQFHGYLMTERGIEANPEKVQE